MNSKDRFQKAVRESLNQLVANGEKKITHAKIIANAKYEDGSPVGKTTLYAKNAVTKEPIHGTLIDEINTKIANLPKNDLSKKKTSIETNQLLIQMVEIENSFENTAHRNDENQIQDLELNLYILAFLLNSPLLGRGHPELYKTIKSFEAKHHGKPKMEFAKEQIQKMKNEIECSKVISMKGSFKED